MAVATSQNMKWLVERSRPGRGAICGAVAWAWTGGLLAVAQAYLLSRVIHGVLIETLPPRGLAMLCVALAAALA